MQRIVILGGSFNPVHIGHLRLAIEAGEALSATRCDLVPSFAPPHKQAESLLPFELRFQALQLAAKENPTLFVNDIEARRQGPSYTIDTLKAYREQFPLAELYFLLGLADFCEFGTWLAWQELPNLANLVAVPRNNQGQAEFLAAAEKFWPGATQSSPSAATPCASVRSEKNAPLAQGQFKALPPGSLSFTTKLPSSAVSLSGRANNESTAPFSALSGQIIFLPLPRLDISSSLLRAKFACGQNLNYLVPAEALSFLMEHKNLLQRHWLAN